MRCVRLLGALMLATTLGSLVATADRPGTADAASTIESHYAAPGPYAVATGTATSSQGYTYDLYYPADYATLGFKSPIITWGNGTGASPADYTTLFDHLVSYGFTIVASTLPNTGSGREILAGAQYMVAQDATPHSIFNGRLDVHEVASVGHSQGAGGATNAATDDPALIKTLMTFSLPSTVWVSSNPDCPQASDCMFEPAALTRPAFFIATHGPLDLIIASPPVEASYYASVPGRAVNGEILASDGRLADHSSIENAANGGNPDGFLGYATAWLMYRLRGDSDAARAFTGPNPELLGNANWPGSAAKP